MSGDLQEKLEKYERKAAHYQAAAQGARSAADRALYTGLAGYCDDLAAKFRQVIAKRADANPFVAANDTGLMGTAHAQRLPKTGAAG